MREGQADSSTIGVGMSGTAPKQVAPFTFIAETGTAGTHLESLVSRGERGQPATAGPATHSPPPVPDTDLESLCPEKTPLPHSQHAARSAGRAASRPSVAGREEQHEPVQLVTTAGEDSPPGPCDLITKKLTPSDLNTSTCKNGRVTLPRSDCEGNLPAVANKRHNNVEVIDDEGRKWVFLIKSWPNGSENRRVYVMERVADYFRHKGLKVGDFLIITRREDSRLGVRTTSNVAETRLGERAAASKRTKLAAGSPAPRRRRTPAKAPAQLASLGATLLCYERKLAEVNGSDQWEEAQAAHYPAAHQLAALTWPQSAQTLHQPHRQGLLIAKQLTNHDVKTGRVVLPRISIETNLPEVVSQGQIFPDLVDAEGQVWPAAIKTWANGPNKRMFILEQLGSLLRHYSLQVGDCIGISRQADMQLGIAINTAEVRAAAKEPVNKSSRPSSADSMAATDSQAEDEDYDPNRRSSSRVRKFKAGLDLDFSRLLGKRQRLDQRAAGSAFEDSLEPCSQDANSQGMPEQSTLSADEAIGTHQMRQGHTVVVAKVLTNSDATSGRVILPRVAVETNLPFLVGYRSWSLDVKDMAGQVWDFVIKSWANGQEHRRVYVLEQVNDFMKTNRLAVGDALGICTDASGAFTVEVNTEAVKAATQRPNGAPHAAPVQPPAPGRNMPMLIGEVGKCTRNPTCTKGDGHPGFCAGPRPRTSRGKRDSSEELEQDDALMQEANPSSTRAPARSQGRRVLGAANSGGNLPDAANNEAFTAKAKAARELQASAVRAALGSAADPNNSAGFAQLHPMLRPAGATRARGFGPRCRVVTTRTASGSMKSVLRRAGESGFSEDDLSDGEDCQASPFANAATLQPVLRQLLVHVACGGLKGIYDVRAGVVLVTEGQVTDKSLSPAEFEQQAGKGHVGHWKHTIQVDTGLPADGSPPSLYAIGVWLKQQGITVDEQGKDLSGSPFRQCIPLTSAAKQILLRKSPAGAVKREAARRASSAPLASPRRPPHEEDSMAAEVLMSLFGVTSTSDASLEDGAGGQAAVQSPFNSPVRPAPRSKAKRTKAKGARCRTTRARPAQQLARTFTTDSLIFNPEQHWVGKPGLAAEERCLERSDSVTFPSLPPAPKLSRAASHAVAIRKHAARNNLSAAAGADQGGAASHQLQASFLEAASASVAQQSGPEASLAEGSHVGSVTEARRGCEMPAVTSPKSGGLAAARRARRSTAKGAAFAAACQQPQGMPPPASQVSMQEHPALFTALPPAAADSQFRALQPALPSRLPCADACIFSAFAAAAGPARSDAHMLALEQAAAADAIMGAQKAAALAVAEATTLANSSRVITTAYPDLPSATGATAAVAKPAVSLFRPAASVPSITTATAAPQIASLQMLLKQSAVTAPRPEKARFLGLPTAPETPALAATRSPTPFQPWKPYCAPAIQIKQDSATHCLVQLFKGSPST